MGENLDHTDVHLAQVGELFLSDLYSDVTLVVEGQSLSAHCNILAAKSDYFRTLLSCGLKESHCKEVELKDTPIQAFRLLLRYIYTGQMCLAEQELQVLIDILGLAHRYCFDKLEESISEYLRSTLSVEKICRIFESAKLFEIQPLIESCYSFIDDHSGEVFEHPSFLKLPQHHVIDIFSRDSLFVPEVQIFKAAQKWLELNNRGKEEGEEKDILPSSEDVAVMVLSKVRLELISVDDLYSVVRPTNLISLNNLLDAIQSSLKNVVEQRSKCLEDENVVTSERGAKVIRGINGKNLWDGGSDGYASHKLVDKELLTSLVANDGSNGDYTNESGIVIKLGGIFTINHLQMKLWDNVKHNTSYSYIIDISLDGKNWVRVINYSEFPCRSCQYLFFPPHVARFIRVIGTANTSEDFRMVSLKAFYTSKAVSHDKEGIINPSSDVVRENDSAIMSVEGEGGGSEGKGMLGTDGDWTHHDHGGYIMVQLAQPYALDSMRFLLLEDQYPYSVEVSADNKKWERIWDHKPTMDETVWQKITFSSRPVVFFKMKGKLGSRFDSFFCSEFACPSPVADGGETGA